MSRTCSPASPVYIETLRRDTSIGGTLSREGSLDSAVYQSPQEEAAYFDRQVNVGRPKMNRHTRKYSRKMQRNPRVALSKVEVPEEFEQYIHSKKAAEECKRRLQENTEDVKNLTQYQRFEKLRAQVLDSARDHIVAEIQLLRTPMDAHHPITVSPTPLDPDVQQRFLHANQLSSFDITFHGTNRTNYESIFHKGLCVPNTHGVTVKNGSAHGVGIYSSTSASYSRGYSNVTALLVCAHCNGTGKSVGTMRVSFDQTHVTPIAVVSWGEESAEAITQYRAWHAKWNPKHYQSSNVQYDEDDAVYKFELNVFYEGLRNYLESQQPLVRWMKRVDRRKKGKELERMRRSDLLISRLHDE